MENGDLLGGPVVKTPCFQCRGQESNPSQGTKIPHTGASQPKEKKEENEIKGFLMFNAKHFHNEYFEKRQITKVMYSMIPIWEKKAYIIDAGKVPPDEKWRSSDRWKKRALKIDKIWKMGWVLTLTWV